MKVTYISETIEVQSVDTEGNLLFEEDGITPITETRKTSTGPVTGFNRGPMEGESFINIDPSKDMARGYGYDQYDKYTVVDGTLTLKPQEEIDSINNSKIFENTLTAKVAELKAYLDFLAGSSVPKSNSKNQFKMISRQVKLLRKEIKGTTSVKELEELDAMEALDNYLDAITDCYDVAEAYLKDSSRTVEELENYNVQVDPAWPIMGE